MNFAAVAASQSRLINWGYVSAHHGLPYVDFAWPDAELRKRWLAPCTLPYEPKDTDPEGKSASARDLRCMSLVDMGVPIIRQIFSVAATRASLAELQERRHGFIKDSSRATDLFREDGSAPTNVLAE